MKKTIFSGIFLGKSAIYAFKKCFNILTESNRNVLIASEGLKTLPQVEDLMQEGSPATERLKKSRETE